MKRALIVRTVMDLIEPAIRSRADSLFILAHGRPGSAKRYPTIARYYETGLVVAIYEYLLMSYTLSHLEISHEKKYSAKTHPEQVDLWIRPPNGGTPTLIECGDFTAQKFRRDAKKMRRLNPKGTNWFLAFFRDDIDEAKNPWKTLQTSRRKSGNGGLKGMHIGLEKRFTGHFRIKLPLYTIHFGWAMIRVN